MASEPSSSSLQQHLSNASLPTPPLTSVRLTRVAFAVATVLHRGCTMSGHYAHTPINELTTTVTPRGLCCSHILASDGLFQLLHPFIPATPCDSSPDLELRRMARHASPKLNALSDVSPSVKDVTGSCVDSLCLHQDVSSITYKKTCRQRTPSLAPATNLALYDIVQSTVIARFRLL